MRCVYSDKNTRFTFFVYFFLSIVSVGNSWSLKCVCYFACVYLLFCIYIRYIHNFTVLLLYLIIYDIIWRCGDVAIFPFYRKKNKPIIFFHLFQALLSGVNAVSSCASLLLYIDNLISEIISDGLLYVCWQVSLYFFPQITYLFPMLVCFISVA